MYRRAAPRTHPAHPRRIAGGGAGTGRGRLPVIRASAGHTRHRRTGPGMEAGLGARRAGGGRRRVGGRLRRRRVAPGPADAVDRPARPCRTTVSTPICTSAPICSTTCRRICTDRTGGTAPRSPPRPGTRTTRCSSPGSTTAPRSGSTATCWPTATASSACTSHHELDVTPWIRAGQPNTLAVKVTPEQALQDVNGVELADSWWDWINWRYIGYQGPGKNPAHGKSFVPDRNAGIWKPVYLQDDRRRVARRPPRSTPNCPCPEPIPLG